MRAPISRDMHVMDEHLEKLIRDLGEAINHAVDESEDIRAALERIRACGHDIIFVLEATFAYREREGDAPPAFREISVEQRLAEISREDRQFLKSLNIRFDNEE
jgi:hypothetical protein